MNDIQAAVVSQPITATVAGSGAISATVGANVVAATVVGGVGPQGVAGPQGPAGPAITMLDQLADVVSANPAENDVLRYEGGVWKNEQLVINGGNF